MMIQDPFYDNRGPEWRFLIAKDYYEDAKRKMEELKEKMDRAAVEFANYKSRLK